MYRKRIGTRRQLPRKARKNRAGRQATAVGLADLASETRNNESDSNRATGFANSTYSSTDYAIETIDLQRVYRRGAEAVYALRGVDLAIHSGQLHRPQGSLGQRQDHAAQLRRGFNSPTSGIARIFGQEIGSWSKTRRTTWRRQQVGFIFRSLRLLPVMSAYENVKLALRLDRYAGQVAA